MTLFLCSPVGDCKILRSILVLKLELCFQSSTFLVHAELLFVTLDTMFAIVGIIY